MRVVVPARAFGEEWALENPGDYPGTIVELDERRGPDVARAAARPRRASFFVEAPAPMEEYEDGPTSTDAGPFFVEAPSPMEEDEASEAPAAPPDPMDQDLPLAATRRVASAGARRALARKYGSARNRRNLFMCRYLASRSRADNSRLQPTSPTPGTHATAGDVGRRSTCVRSGRRGFTS